MSTFARWCLRHRLIVVLLWVTTAIGLGVAAGSAGTAYDDKFTLPGTDSAKAIELLQANLPERSGDAGTIVWHTDSGSVRDAAVRQRMTATLDRVAALPHIASVTGPYATGGAGAGGAGGAEGAGGDGQISRDGRTAFAQIAFDGDAADVPVADIEKVIDTAKQARTDGLRVELGGNVITRAEQPPPNTAEFIGIAAAAVVLFIAFGSLFAMLMPIVTAVIALAAGLMTIGLLSHVMPIGQIGPILGALIGLGVGIDYALFIVTRHRNGLLAGRPVEKSIVAALDTSGRAVLFAGGTVVIALLGLFVLGMDFLNGLAIASVTTVTISVLASVTLLPAMLGFVGPRVLSRKERRALALSLAAARLTGPVTGPVTGPAAGPGTGPGGGPGSVSGTASGTGAEAGVFHRWAGFAQRRSGLLAVVAIGLIAVLTVPVFSIRLGISDAGNNPASTTTRQAYDLLSQGFGPGFNDPFQLVAQTPSDADRQAFTRFAETVRGTPGVASVVPLPQPPGATVGVLRVVPTTSPQAEETAELIRRVREVVVPAAERGTTMQVYVGGSIAVFDDFAHEISRKIPVFVSVIVGLGFLLLLVAFRSIVVPLTAAAMNVLATLASFGLLVAFFQWGWGSEPLGLSAPGPIETFLPVIMISILFGLSMDYQVFLVSRMHEEWVHSRDNTRAVIVGQAHTGRVITAAATIMIAVFGAFSLAGGERAVAMFGIGLASAVAIDAFILRTMLVPALMHLFGDANWWLPRRLDRVLPHLSVDPPEEQVEPEEPEKELARA